LVEAEHDLRQEGDPVERDIAAPQPLGIGIGQGFDERTGMRHRQGCHAQNFCREALGGDPSDGASKVVAHNVESIETHGGGDGGDVGGQLLLAVGSRPGRPCARAVAALVEGDDAKAGPRQSVQQGLPHDGCFGEAVQQDHAVAAAIVETGNARAKLHAVGADADQALTGGIEEWKRLGGLGVRRQISEGEP
jgi:hypothetical protein